MGKGAEVSERKPAHELSDDELRREIAEALYGEKGAFNRADLFEHDHGQIVVPNWPGDIGAAFELAVKVGSNRGWEVSVREFDDVPEGLRYSVGFYEFLDSGFAHNEHPTRYTVAWMGQAYGEKLSRALSELACIVLREMEGVARNEAP